MTPLELFKYRKSLQYERDLMDLKKEYGDNLLEIQPGKTLIERLLPEKWVQPMLSAEARLKARESKTVSGLVFMSQLYRIFTPPCLSPPTGIR